jgi:hypothetical protein
MCFLCGYFTLHPVSSCVCCYCSMACFEQSRLLLTLTCLLSIVLLGPIDPTKTCFVQHCSMVVCTKDLATSLYIEPRDEYGNLCTYDPSTDQPYQYEVKVVEVCTISKWMHVLVHTATWSSWVCQACVFKPTHVLLWPLSEHFCSYMCHIGPAILSSAFWWCLSSNYTPMWDHWPTLGAQQTVKNQHIPETLAGTWGLTLAWWQW